MTEVCVWTDQKIKETECFNTVVGGKCTQILYAKLTIGLAICKEKKVLRSALTRIFYIKPLGIGVFHMEAA